MAVGRLQPRFRHKNVHEGLSRRTVHLGRFGAKGDGTSDDSRRLESALDSGEALTGGGQIFAVDGDFTMPDNFFAEDATLLQMSPDSTTRRTLTKVSGSGPMVLRRLKIDRNGTGTSGGKSTAAGIWIDGIDDIDLEDIEITGDGAGFGIIFLNGSRIKLTRPYIHDVRATSVTEPAEELLGGLIISVCNDVEIIDPYISELTISIDGADYIPGGFSDGITIGNCTNLSVRGGTIKRCGDGSDVSGGSSNNNVWFYGTTYEDCNSAQKFVHEANNCGSIGCRAYRSGLYGLLIGGTTHTGHPQGGPRNIRVSNFMAIDTGYSGLYQDIFSVTGIAVNSGEGGIYAPQNVTLTDCMSIDTQTAVCTLTIASPCVVTKTAHGKENDDRVYFKTTGTLPTGLTAYTMYYVVNKTTDTFQVALTAGGTAINTSGSQSNTHSCSMPTMEYGFRNETGVALNCRIINPYELGGKLGAFQNATEGVWVPPDNASINVAYLVGTGGIGTTPRWDRNLVATKLLARTRDNLTLSNGLNSNLATPATSVILIAGPTAAFSLGGIDPSSLNSEMTTFINTTDEDMTFVHNDGSTTDATHRIWCPGLVDYVVTGFYSSVTLWYNGSLSRWNIIGKA